MVKLIAIIPLLILLSSCSSAQPQQHVPERIDYTDGIKSCAVYSDRIECLLSDGNLYYIRNYDINKIVKWNSSAWKENVVYCEITNTTNITNSKASYCKNTTQKFCNKGEMWVKC